MLISINLPGGNSEICQAAARDRVSVMISFDAFSHKRTFAVTSGLRSIAASVAAF
ncbi:hypothetical protein P775_28680 [Puniceibacterium antarcticum]|uniref:Uncharacterized protein n=1 Tax=Puniceibacterium antarcticum TaxID=1206336 RepID=A0A2G8QQZ6_9RHOB|nr:hypothetical protein P775_28680 [Puniceibacterium antarcticum]